MSSSDENYALSKIFARYEIVFFFMFWVLLAGLIIILLINPGHLILVLLLSPLLVMCAALRKICLYLSKSLLEKYRASVKW